MVAVVVVGQMVDLTMMMVMKEKQLK